MTRPITGLRDSNGAPIFVGDRLKTSVTCNEEKYGQWAMYRVVQRGIVPVLVYVESEKGQVLPQGMAGGVLSDQYDLKALMTCDSGDDLRPIDTLVNMDTAFNTGFSVTNRC
tara:strand:+ start:107 stop:442 length:336 start_codon:yes stop_codon:yes gene_type:complete